MYSKSNYGVKFFVALSLSLSLFHMLTSRSSDFDGEISFRIVAALLWGPSMVTVKVESECGLAVVVAVLVLSSVLVVIDSGEEETSGKGKRRSFGSGFCWRNAI